MSTRCQVSFEYNGERSALVYKHHDGYPTGEHGMFQLLQNFFEAVEADTTDTRFSDAEYLAAKFVVYLVGGRGLDFLGVGVSQNEHGDIEYMYHVNCAEHTTKGRPLVTVDDLCEDNTIPSPFNDSVKPDVKIVRFDYVNKAGERSNRLVKVTEENDTMIKGVDLDKNEFRAFSRSTMKNLKEVTI